MYPFSCPAICPSHVAETLILQCFVYPFSCRAICPSHVAETFILQCFVYPFLCPAICPSHVAETLIFQCFVYPFSCRAICPSHVAETLILQCFVYPFSCPATCPSYVIFLAGVGIHKRFGARKKTGSELIILRIDFKISFFPFLQMLFTEKVSVLADFFKKIDLFEKD